MQDQAIFPADPPRLIHYQSEFLRTELTVRMEPVCFGLFAIYLVTFDLPATQRRAFPRFDLSRNHSLSQQGNEVNKAPE